MLPWNVDGDIRAMIRTGTIAYELCRPVDLYSLWFARAVAWRTAPTLLRSIPMALFAIYGLPAIGFASWRLQTPAQGALPAFAASLLCTVLLSSAITTLMNILLMWTISADGMVVFTALITVFSGLIVPLPLFPDWMQPLLRVLPFAGLADLPYRIYLGTIAPASLPGVLALQLGWTALFVALGRFILPRGLNQIAIQGG